MNFSNEERLNLKKLIDNNSDSYVDNTSQIRKLKHSIKIRDDIREMEIYKAKNQKLKQKDYSSFEGRLQEKCSFLFNNYTDIFNKLLKDEIDLDIMQKLLYVLNLIEEEKLDQNEGSVAVGKILKELYIDSALRRADNLDKEHEGEIVPKEEGKKHLQYPSEIHSPCLLRVGQA
jgi:hypothetical protein